MKEVAIRRKLPFLPSPVQPGVAGRASLTGRVLPLLLIAAGIAAIFGLKGYQLLQATNIVAYSIAILGLNLLSGYNGQISLGHGAFLAIGGYATAILMDRLGVPFWLAVPLSGLASMGVGFLIAIPALRLELLYLALATFSLAVAVPQLAKNKLVSGLTGGAQGLQLSRPPAWSALGLNVDQTLYAFSLLIAVLAFAAVRNLVRGRVGRAIEAIRDQPIAADTMAINTRLYKTATFGVSSFLTGIAGGIGAVATGFVSPDSYGFFLSITLLVGAVIGGFRSTYGALFGGAFIVLMPNYAEKLSQGAPWAIYGAFTIILMFAMPEGFAGLSRAIESRVSRTKKAASKDPKDRS